jgi:hypothetical protein
LADTHQPSKNHLIGLIMPPGVVRLPDSPNHKPFHIQPWVQPEICSQVIVYADTYDLETLCAGHEVDRKWHVFDRKSRVPERKIFVTHSKQRRSERGSERNLASTAFS